MPKNWKKNDPSIILVYELIPLPSSPQTLTEIGKLEGFKKYWESSTSNIERVAGPLRKMLNSMDACAHVSVKDPTKAAIAASIQEELELMAAEVFLSEVRHAAEEEGEGISEEDLKVIYQGFLNDPRVKSMGAKDMPMVELRR